MNELVHMGAAGSHVLRQVAASVHTITDVHVNLARDMKVAMIKADGIGLAAPQIGQSVRMFVYGNPRHRAQATVINPVITESSSELVTMEEGCLSIPGEFCRIERPYSVRIQGFDLSGNELDWDAEGVYARLFQHELDHLNGVLMIDLLPEEERRAIAMKFLPHL